MKAVMVTGATGFLGCALTKHLAKHGFEVRRGLRSPVVKGANCGRADFVVGSIDSQTDWSKALEDVSVVVHLAARVHVMEERSVDPLKAFCVVNVDGTERLARQAVEAGVKRLIYLSSIKVNGESTDGRAPFCESDEPSPQDSYGVSKWRAEEALRRVGEETGLEVVIIRPPLVYGPGVKANFLSMMRWVARGVPLPLGAIHNRRSLVALGNLVDFITTCTEHPSAANHTFLVADGDDLSTTDLLQRVGDALGKPARLVPMPAWLLEAGGAIVGKGAIVRRLCGSLQVDISKAHQVLGWAPPISVEEALRETASAFWEGEGR